MKEWLKQGSRHLLLPAVMLLALAGSCERRESENQQIVHEDHVHQPEEEVYTCPMHPEIRQNEPGICPICKMDMVKIGKDGKASGLDLGQVLKPADKAVLSSVGTVKPDSMTVRPQVLVHGKIDFDPRQQQIISSNFRGRIDKLFIRYNYQPVEKGQALLEIFSEELQNAQENYLFLLKNDAEAGSLIQSAEEKLKLLGMTTGQVQKIRSSGKISPRITLYSPAKGMVVERAQEEAQNAAERGGTGSKDMVNMSGEPVVNQNFTISEGSYIDRGEKIFTVIATDQVWGILEVHGRDAGLIRKGQQVKVRTSSGDSIYGKVDFIDPDFGGSKNMKVRVYMDNRDEKLFVGDLLTGRIEATPVKGLFLPSSAVVDLGQHKVVFLQKDGLYVVQPVKTGVSVPGYIQIIDGLDKTEKVAKNAAFLVDSESFIRIERK